MNTSEKTILIAFLGLLFVLIAVRYLQDKAVSGRLLLARDGRPVMATKEQK